MLNTSQLDSRFLPAQTARGPVTAAHPGAFTGWAVAPVAAIAMPLGAAIGSDRGGPVAAGPLSGGSAGAGWRTASAPGWAMAAASVRGLPGAAWHVAGSPSAIAPAASGARVLELEGRTSPFASPWDIALPPLASPGLSRPGAVLAEAGSLPVRRGFTGVAASLKRATDLACGAVLLGLALPLLLVVALALRLESPGPVLFVQRRVGRDGQPFACIKLRTMHADAERRLLDLLAACPHARREWTADQKLRDDPRVSRLGRLVRKLSLDELPQLANVLAGQMSLVGPRPIIQAEIPRYGPFFADYCAVKPGLTGLWQVSGRNDVTYAERVQLDRHYVRHASLLLDLRIALRTVPAVLRACGSY